MSGESENTTRDLLAAVKAWQAESSGRLSGGDLYFVVFSLLVVGSCLISALVSIAGDSGCVLWGCAQPHSPVWGLLPLAIATVAGLAGRMLGPLFASRGELAMLYRAPLSRYLLLKKTRRNVLAVAALGGAVIGAVLGLWHGYSVLLGIPCLLGGVAGVVMSERWQLLGPKAIADRYFCSSAAVGIASSASAVWWLADQAAGGLVVWAGIMAGLAVVCVAIARLSGRSLDQISITSLGSADSLRNGLQGAAMSMDVGLIVDVIQARSRSVCASGSGALHGQGVAAIVLTELRRTVNCERRSGIAGLLAIAAGLLSVTVGGQQEYIVAVLLTMVGMVLQLGGLRRVSTSPGLRRVFPVRRGRLRSAFSVPGVVSALAWTIVVAGYWTASGLPSCGLLPAIAALWLGLAAAVRWTAVRPPDFSVGLIITDLGVIPLGALLTSLRGWDIALIGAVALTGGGIWALPVCVACIGFGLLHG